MQLPIGVEAAPAVASAMTAASGTSLLVSSTRRRTRRQAHHLLVLGAGLAALSTIAGLVGLLVLAGHWDHHQSERTTLADVVSVGIALSGTVLCAGLLRLPGVADTVAAASRLVLDGLMTGAALWFVGWVLLSEPTRVLGDATPVACQGILLATVTAAGAIGLTSVVGMRSPRPRPAVTVMGSGVCAVAVGGLGLAAGLCQAGSGLAWASAAVLPAGLLVVALANRTTDEPGEPDPHLLRRGTRFAFLPMLAMAVAAISHLLVDGQLTAWGVTAWIVAGFTLVIRQYLTLLDASGYADQLVEREAHFRELAHTDPLTGLANRRGLLRALRSGTSCSTCVLLCLDLDGFKHVNDMRGHDVGDGVLNEVGQRLRLNLRPGDLAARLGGDEFAVLMWTRPLEAQRSAERLLGVLSRPYEHAAGPLFLSVSIGVAGCATADDVEGLLRNADLALRHAKQRGKNRIEQYDLDYDLLLSRRTVLEHEMRGAIERGELHLAFQPVVAMPSVRPVGAEALLRWHHPELGNVRPDEFIPLAEECGMIAKLGAWVLHQACHQLSIWLADGHDVWVSVNVSPRELHAPAYVTQVAEALLAHRVPPQRLVLEITEHAVATDLDELIRRLRALRATGVRIALDDFGAGYSSLGQLRRLPIDILKIDHSLVAEPEPAFPAGREGRPFAPMVDVVMRLGHQLGLEVIAEGVTSQSEFTAVVEAGCRFGQGQLFGWGVPAEYFEALLDAATSPAARALPAVGATDASRQTAASAQRLAEIVATTPVAQNVRSVDSSREMRQA